MKLKLLKEYVLTQDGKEETLPVDSVIELADADAQALIDAGNACMYDEEAEAKALKASVEAKALELKASAEPAQKHEDKTMYLIGKTIKALIEGKATGMTGASTLAGVEATEVLGQIANTSVVFNKAKKLPVSGNLRVIYSKSASGSPTVLPVIGIVSEGTGAGTTVPMGTYDAIPGKWFATVAVTSELAEDVAALDAFVMNELRSELAIAIDNSALNGAFTNNVGLKGVIDDANAAEAVFADLDAPTLEELTAMVGKVNPALHGASEWYINPEFWAVLEGELMTADNVANQLIKTGKEKTLLGFPVNVSFAVPAANPAVFGDMGQYVIGLRRDIEIVRDDSVLFDSDEIMFKIRCRLAGGLAAGLKTYEGVDYAAVAYASESGS